MQTRREALGMGLAAAMALGTAGCLSDDTGDPGPGPDDRTPGNDEDNDTPDNDEYDLPSDYIDVREYGATGDGKSDDSKAIQSAIEAAEPGETVFLPETGASYLLSLDESRVYGDDAIQLSGDSGLDDITVLGETAREGAQTLQVEARSYSEATNNSIIKIEPNGIIDGFKLKNLTIDGARPEDDQPAGQGGEAAVTGVLLTNGAGGGHDIVLEDVLIQNCSASALRFAESGVTCRRVTSRGHGWHGFNPVAADTTVDPGFVGQSIKAVNCDGTGIDHRRGTARLTHVYTENNRAGNKWKHHVERLEVKNHHSVNDQNHGWRSNHTASSGDYTPSQQDIIFDDIFIESSLKTGMRVSGSDTEVACDFGNVEIRGAWVESPEAGAGVRLLRNVETINSDSEKFIIAGTINGVGMRVYKSALNINTYYYSGNEMGELAVSGNGEVVFENKEKRDPGRNFFQTPGQNNTGAFTEPLSEE